MNTNDYGLTGLAPDLNLNPAIGKEIQEKSVLENRVRSGANWFYWIAGLSALNSVISITGSSVTFILGLGITQFVDVFAQAFAQEIPESKTIFLGTGLFLSVVIASFFAGIGYLARRTRWIYTAGMILYALDGLLLLFFGDYLGFGFHLYALYGLYRGYRASVELGRFMERNQPAQNFVPV